MNLEQKVGRKIEQESQHMWTPDQIGKLFWIAESDDLRAVELRKKLIDAVPTELRGKVEAVLRIK